MAFHDCNAETGTTNLHMKGCLSTEQDNKNCCTPARKQNGLSGVSAMHSQDDQLLGDGSWALHGTIFSMDA